MKHSGSADLKLMGGSIPIWLFDRMTRLSLPIVEAIITEYGHQTFLSKISDPFWFQSFGAVIGMDWNSSGVTTAVMSALKKSLNPHSKELGIYICGGKGKASLETPNELLAIGDKTGLNGYELSHFSKLTAKIDNTAVQDGFNLYIHNFIVSSQGDWSVIQQGMQANTNKARRYHWHSANIDSFIEEPHTGICGENQGQIINLVDKQAKLTQEAIIDIVKENPDKMISEIRKLTMPMYTTIKSRDVDIKRLGSILWLAQESQITRFEDLLLFKGIGPRTLQSLALVSEIIHGTPTRFNDPARFSFAHGGKGGNPFPVPTTIYDETISMLTDSVEKSRIGDSDKATAIKKLSLLAEKAEKNFTPNHNLEELIQKEKNNAWKYGGRTINGYVKPPNTQLNLFPDSI